MKRTLVFVTILSSAILACQPYDPQTYKYCVDSAGRVVDDDRCHNDKTNTHPFVWYYGGVRPFTHGQTVTGGSYHPTSSRSYVSSGGHLSSSSSHSNASHVSSPSSRGGFGSGHVGSMGS